MTYCFTKLHFQQEVFLVACLPRRFCCVLLLGMWLLSVFPLAGVSLRSCCAEQESTSCSHQLTEAGPTHNSSQLWLPWAKKGTWRCHGDLSTSPPRALEFGVWREERRDERSGGEERGQERRVWNEFNKKRIGKSVKSVNGEMKEDETEREWQRKWSQWNPVYQRKHF